MCYQTQGFFYQKEELSPYINIKGAQQNPIRFLHKRNLQSRGGWLYTCKPKSKTRNELVNLSA